MTITKFAKLISVAAMVALTFTSVEAQVDRQNNSRFGVKGGVNVSNMFTEDVDSKNPLVGFNGGFFLRVALTPMISFQPELLFTMKGSELAYNNSFVSGTAKFSLNYFEVPLLAVVNITKNVNLQGGIYLASLTTAKVKNVSNINLFNFENELKKENFNSLDYGLVVGLGTDFDKLSFGLRYEFGLQKVGKERTFPTRNYTFADGRNSTLQLYIGISIL